MKKRVLACLLTAAMISVNLLGCSGNSGTAETKGGAAQESGKETASGSGDSKEVTELVLWHTLTGNEEQTMIQAVDAFNANHDDIHVEALSVSDRSKFVVAMSGDDGPDIIRSSNTTNLGYYKQGLVTGLNSFIENDSFDLSQFRERDLNASRVDGELVIIPCNTYDIQMYYNKDILESLGYTEPPKTTEEMYQMAVEATTLDENGNIDILGYPLFPLASARQELIYVFGGRWWDEEGNLTPMNQGNLDSLTYNVNYRKQFGIDKVAAFITTANTNRYTENDMFFAGKQLFRFDGPWLPTMMEKFGSTVNYGIVMNPGATEDLRGSSRLEVGGYAICSKSKHKEEAWQFIKEYTTSESAKIENLGTGNLPSYIPLQSDADMLEVPAFKEFIETLSAKNIILYPTITNLSEYTAVIDEYLDYIYYGQMTPEEGLKGIEERIKSITFE